MAEFCLGCWNELNHTRLTEGDVVLSADLDFCEGCEEMKQVIEKYKERKSLAKLIQKRLAGG